MMEHGLDCIDRHYCLKKVKKGDVNIIISIFSLLVCELYMFLKIDFTSIKSIVAGLIMGMIQTFILTSGSLYLLFVSKKCK